MKRNRSTSISRRITLVLLLSMTVLLLVLGGFLWNMVSQTTREMRAYALSMTESMTGILADKTRTIEKTATLIAQNSYVEGYFDSDDVSERTEYIRIFNSLAGNAISENPDILAICLADPDGVAITSGALLDSVVLSSLERQYPGILTNEPFEPFFSGSLLLEGRFPYYAYIMPVYDADNPTPMTQLATCIVLCDLRLVQETLNGQLADSFRSIQLLDAGGSLLCTREVSTPRTGQEELVEHAVSDTGWTIRYYLDFSAFSFSSQTLGLLGAVSVVCLVMLVAIAITIHTGLARPVDTLIRRLQDGKYLTRMGLHFGNELDIIVDTIESTFGRLEQASEERLQSETRMYAMQLHLRESELSALQSQINPHFLYNTLECMRSIGLYYNSPEIVTISTAMTDIFRYSIKASSMVPLRSELNIIRKYLSIISIRFDNRFHIHFDIAPETEEVIIPKMTLQPIVENAIYHGLESRKGEGMLTVYARLHAGELVLVIEDNGLGMKPEDVAAMNLLLRNPDMPVEQGGKRSIGLTNIARRIHLFSQGKCSVSISSKENEGTTVSVKLPASTE